LVDAVSVGLALLAAARASDGGAARAGDGADSIAPGTRITTAIAARRDEIEQNLMVFLPADGGARQYPPPRGMVRDTRWARHERRRTQGWVRRLTPGASGTEQAAPLTVVVAGVGLGGGTENDLADAAAGRSGLLPSEAPAQQPPPRR